MDKETLKQIIIEEIIKIQKLNGVEEIDIDDDTKPIGGLESFDSLNAIEVLTSLETLIEEDLDIECDLDVSVFFTDQGKAALRNKVITHNSLTIDEIANNILKTIST